MAYRSRSKYTPGGGVLAFFEQVSRFVSLSVAVWIAVSLFLILFVADGKITDSFDLRLFRGLFTNWQIFWTALMLVALSGLIGALISLPASLVLLLSRQYLDFQLGRSSRRNAVFRIYFVKNLPAMVLVLSHFIVFSLNIISAPQLSRAWLKEGNKISELIAGGHFVMTSLTRGTASQTPIENPQSDLKRVSAGKSRDARRVHLILVPAEQIESNEFVAEQAKLAGAVRIPFVIQRSSITDQLDYLLAGVQGPTAELARKAIQNPKDYAKAIVKNKSQAMVSISPQVRFGKQLVGYGTETLTGFNDSLLLQEAQRRLVLSQLQLFGFFRVFDGVPFLGTSLTWLNLIADDVARLRQSATVVSSLKENLNSLIIIQLSGMEKEFKSVRSPFRPSGWQLQQSSFENRIVNKNFVRELIQYLHDVDARDSAHWIILPYADDRRTDPRSFAIVSARSELLKQERFVSGAPIGAITEDISHELSGYLDEAKNRDSTLPSAHSTDVRSSEGSQLKTQSGAKLSCFETEADFNDPDFKFQPVDVRERSLGQLLNSLPLMPDSDLSFLGKSMANLVSRELGLGFLCRTQNQTIEEIYLLKHRGVQVWNSSSKGLRQGGSVLLNKSNQKSTDAQRLIKTKAPTPSALQSFLPKSIRPEVLEEFAVLHLVPGAAQSEGNLPWTWRRMDERESQYFFSRFELDALQAIELSARARIR